MIKVIYHPVVPVLQIICTVSFVAMLAAGFIEAENMCVGCSVTLVVSGFLLCVFGDNMVTASDKDDDDE